MLSGVAAPLVNVRSTVASSPGAVNVPVGSKVTGMEPSPFMVTPGPAEGGMEPAADQALRPVLVNVMVKGMALPRVS